MSVTKILCAIYTRKSSEEGLEQSFNSLDAQYEACAAYIASQKHEGWILARERFDDGGQSGGTLERPALERLLAAINANRIRMVVVYKIDRLTRSLADFARLVERFDAAGCSFVSVTQAFNTASSMGRLTLNVLLSFAQFEREVTAERIRDKIAASKKQGLWMGGLCPLGYDPHPDPMTRELVVNDAEARTVRKLFDLYDRHGRLIDVEREATAQGLCSKNHRFASGRVQGGGHLSRGQIHKILTNPVYLGQIRHKEQIWPGRHPAIIDDDLWARVQQRLQEAARRPRGQTPEAQTAPLIGKLRDETGDRLTPTHSLKHGRRHTYYVSHRLITGGTDPAGWRLPARRLEAQIAGAIADHLDRARTEHRLLQTPDLRADTDPDATAGELVQHLRQRPPNFLSDLLAAGRITPRTLHLDLDGAALAQALQIPRTDLSGDLLNINVPLRLRRRGIEAKLVIGQAHPEPDPVLLRALLQAHRWATALRTGTPLGDLARSAGKDQAVLRKRIRLAFLAPRIQRAILDGTFPPEHTLCQILPLLIPLDWEAQAHLFGM